MAVPDMFAQPLRHLSIGYPQISTKENLAPAFATGWRPVTDHLVSRFKQDRRLRRSRRPDARLDASCQGIVDALQQHAPDAKA